MKYLGIKGCKQSPCKLSWQLFGNIIAPVGIVVISLTRGTRVCGRGEGWIYVEVFCRNRDYMSYLSQGVYGKITL